MPGKKALALLLTFAFILTAVLVFSGVVRFALADELDEINEKIEEKEKEYESTSKKLSDIRNKQEGISNKLAQLGSQLNVTQEEIKELEDSINAAEEELAIINANLANRKGSLAQKITLRNEVVRDYSKRGILNDLEMFFAASRVQHLSGFQFSAYNHAFDKTLSRETLKFIEMLNTEIDTFEADKAEGEKLKAELEVNQQELVALKAQLESQKNLAQSEKSNLDRQEKSYEEELADITEALEELTAKQQAILDAKSGGENGSVGNYEPPESKTPDAPFSPAFAAFSYGAYTHYKGMSQYGAKGRAEAGQDYEEILEFYYKKGITEIDTDEICVQGHGEMDFQEYLYGLAEMPSDWPEDALKAQAIAGRSYAYRYAKDGKCICTSQSCQVFLKSKSDNPPSRWKDAVDDTEGQILEDGVVAYYSSTTGGYIDNIGWDGTWPGSSYEKKAGSPWFRKAWYTKSYNDSSNCGRAHPWLTAEEMADIVNSYVVWSNGSGSEKERISPVTTSCWGGDPYSISEMREKADKYGKSYKKVTSIEAINISNGKTGKVRIETDNGTVEMDGQIFKTVFNLRAPSYISLKSRLFDFEEE